MQGRRNAIWAPQEGPQKAFVDCPYTLIGFGGARGGGKTSGVIGKFGIKQERLKKAFNGIFFRKELTQADDLIEEAREVYCPLGAKYQAHKSQFTFPAGGRLRFRPLDKLQDAEKYQGQNLSDCAVEEVGNYSDPAVIWKLFGALRGGTGEAQMSLTFNPGGSGHYWLKELFIKPAPLGMVPLQWKLPTGNVITYIYIPSRVTDNKILLEKDPAYIDRLHMVGSPELVRAWLEGDFEIHAGSYFPEFGLKHIIEPFAIPKHWQRYIGYDHGYASNYAAVWGAISSGKDDAGNEVPYPKGAIIIYREAVGNRTENQEIGNNIGRLSFDEGITSAVADPSIFKTEGGPSIADQIKPGMIHYKVPVFRRADNDRLSGWGQIRSRLKQNMLFIFSNCSYIIDTLPTLQHCPKNAEDLDTTGEDHAADALRYLCKERILPSEHKKESVPVGAGIVRVQKYIEQVRAEQRRSRL